MTLTGVIASISGVTMALSPLLQARRVRIARDSSEVSRGLFVILGANSCVWIVHGTVTANAVLMIPNAVMLLTVTATLVVLQRYRSRGEPAHAECAPSPLRASA